MIDNEHSIKQRGIHVMFRFWMIWYGILRNRKSDNVDNWPSLNQLIIVSSFKDKCVRIYYKLQQ